MKHYNPPPNPAKTTDSRYGGYIKKFGKKSWELDALNPSTIVNLVQDAILGIRDDDSWDAATKKRRARPQEAYRCYGGDVSTKAKMKINKGGVWTVGDFWYLADGRQVEVVGRFDQKYLVFEVHESEGELVSDYEHPMMVLQVYEAPPTSRLSNEVAILNERVEALKRDISSMSAQKRVYEVEEIERSKRYKRFEQLKKLDDYLDGKITHFAMIPVYGSPKVKTFAEVIKDERERDLRLLCLFGNSKGDLSWRVNRYGDGSGSWEDAVPATSEAEAREMVAEHIKKRFEDGRPTITIVEAAREYGVEIPPEYLGAVTARTLATHEANIRDKEKSLEQARASLDAFILEYSENFTRKEENDD